MLVTVCPFCVEHGTLKIVKTYVHLLASVGFG